VLGAKFSDEPGNFRQAVEFSKRHLDGRRGLTVSATRVAMAAPLPASGFGRPIAVRIA
jgi:hypothetical protein